MTADTDGPGLPFRPEEWEALALKWPKFSDEEKAHYNAQMTRAQRRRLERTVIALGEDEQLWAGKVATRQDVAHIMAAFTERTVFQLAARLDNLERWAEYQQKPWYRKALLTLAVWRAKAVQWLASKGIRFVKLETPEESRGQEANAQEAAEAVLADGGGGRGSDAARGAPVDHAGGTGTPPPTTSSLIEVVPR